MTVTTISRLPLSILPSLTWLLVLAALLHGCHAVCDPRENCVDHLNDIIRVEANINNAIDTCQESELIYAPEGTSERLVCEVTPEVEIVFVSWDFYPSDGSDRVMHIGNTNPRFRNETNQLIMSNIQPDDEGIYVCRVIEGDNPERSLLAGCIVIYSTLVSFNTGTVIPITAYEGEPVVFNTEIVFHNRGSCMVDPNITEVRFRRGGEVFFQCQEEGCDVAIVDGVEYDTKAYGNTTLQRVQDGQYEFAVVQTCPSAVLSRTYSLTLKASKPSTPQVSSVVETATLVQVSSSPTSQPVTTSPAPTDPSVTGATKKDAVTGTAIGVPLAVVLIATIVVVVLVTLYLIHRRGSRGTYKRPDSSHTAEPIYATPSGEINGTALPLHAQEETDYEFAPSSIGGEKVGPYSLDVHLSDKPSDQVVNV